MKDYRHRTAAAVLALMTLLSACGKAAGKAQEEYVPAPAAEAPAVADTVNPESEIQVLEEPEDTTEKVKPVEAEAAPIEENVSGESAEVTPELVEFLESYETFVDEYVEFYKEYSKNPTDMNLLMQYTSLMSEYAEFTENLDKYDSSNMSAADAAYYAEVTLRCSQKMLGMLY